LSVLSKVNVQHSLFYYW